MTTFQIIGVSGRAGAGKDTIAAALRRDGFERIAFADPLKRACAIVFGLTHEQTHGREKEIVDLRWGLSPRQIMQRFGTEAIRDVFGEDVWIKSMAAQIERVRAEGSKRGVVIPDVRFPNEAEAVRAWGGQLWRVVRPDVAAVAEHVSETALDRFQFDVTVHNTGTIDDLRRTTFGLRK